MNNLLSKIPNRYWAYLALSAWAALVFMVLNKTHYGLDEGAAHALLLVWSVTDGVVSPIVTLGLPDFRTLFFIPVGILWTGSVLAAKLTTLLVMSIVVWAFHSWRRHNGEEESSLLATGLLLISPLLLDQLDSMSVAPFLLFTFALGAWADKNYREAKLALGGMYFAQIFLCLVSVTLHPLGLAYPLALLWSWHKNPIDKEHRNYFYYGISFVTLVALVLTTGWSHVTWFMNPFKALAGLLLGPANVADFGLGGWIAGVGAFIVLLLVVLKQAAELWSDLLGRILLLAVLIGLFVGDATFSIVAMIICLYWGLSLLLQKPVNTSSGFWSQRGVALIIVFVIATAFMINDKARYHSMLAGVLTPRDSLIKSLAEDGDYFMRDSQAQNKLLKQNILADQTAPAEPEPQADPNATPVKKRLRVASQWPGLTMLACRCDALPLPPVAKDSEALLAMLKGVNYLVFDPRNPVNSALSRNLATMGAGSVETVDLKPGGVIVLVKHKPAMKASN